MSSVLESTSLELREALNPYKAEDVKMVQSGMMLYRQGMVSRLRYVKEDVLSATIQDVMPAKVELDLSFLPISACSCPADGLCRHLMAVFFAAYASAGSVAEWVEEWRAPVREQEQISKWGVQRAKDLVKGNNVLTPDYDRWVQSFAESFDSLLRAKPYTSPYVIVELFQIYRRRVKAGAPLEQEWRLLYELIADVISFQKLAALSEELGHSEDAVKRTYLHLFHQLTDDCEDLATKIGYQTLPFAFDAFFEKFKEDAFGLLTCAAGLSYDRISLYQLLWTDLFKKNAWRMAELTRIEQRLRRLNERENPLSLMMAGIHLNVLTGEDEQALRLIEAIEDSVVTPYMLFWIELLSQQNAWKRVGPMIELFLQKVRGYLLVLHDYFACSNFARLAIKAIASYCAENGRTDVYERALGQMLPYSFSEYEYLLFERGQYERWSELYAFIGVEFSDLPKDRVKVVEKAQPEVLFGLLHQSAQRAIELKNRQSYREAVRHLKKLRTLYKKAKRLDDWQFFFDNLIEKTKRLRAFHEECRRSKLLEG
ncbi:SWIM zinc finger family protein [Bacillota bacterium Lsc_1132]